MKKRLLLFALALLCYGATQAQTPDWKWLDVMSGTAVSGNSIATDANGNSYIAGNFTSSIGFSSGSLTSLKANSIYIAKYDNTGKLLWVKQADNTKFGALNCTGIALDASGNCYIAGSFTYTAVFDTTHLTTTGSPAAIADIFIAKYDKNGNFVWVLQPTHATTFGYDDAATGIAVDANNMVTVTGTCSGNVNYGTGIKGTGGFHAIFLAQFDKDGKAQWAKHFYDQDGVGSFSSPSVAADKDGNLLLSGNGGGQQSFFGGTGTVNMNTGYFIAKYDNKGAYQWANTVYDALAYAIAVDGAGNPAITGNMRSSVDFDKTTNLKSYGGYDIFVAKYDNGGNLKWVKNIGTTGDEKEASSIIQDGSGNVYISGNAVSDTKFGTRTLPSGNKLPGYGYVAKYDNSGAIQWLQNVDIKSGGTYFSNYTHVYDLAIDGSGNIYATGNTAPYTMFGTKETGGYGTFLSQIGSGAAATPPAAPTNLTATAHKKTDDGKIQLSWTDNSNNETGFIINRSLDNTNWAAIDTAAADATTYLDSNLRNITKFYYKVVAYNSAGSSSASNVVDATTFESGIETGNQPGGLSVYPNPSNSSFAILASESMGQVHIVIHNVMGQLVYDETPAKSGMYHITLPEKYKGLLMIDIYADGKMYHTTQMVR